MKLFTIKDLKMGEIAIAAAGLRLCRPLRIEEVLKTIESKDTIAYQAFDYKAIASWQHLLNACILALKAWVEGRMLAKNLSLEILLYVAGDRRIKEAIDKVGVKESSQGLIILYLVRDGEVGKRLIEEASKKLGGVAEDSLLEVLKDKFEVLKEIFQVGEEELKASIAEGEDELKALVKCILTRTAKLDVDKVT